MSSASIYQFCESEAARSDLAITSSDEPTISLSSAPDLAMIARRGEAIRGLDDLRRWAAAELEQPELDAVTAHIDAIETALKAGFE